MVQYFLLFKGALSKTGHINIRIDCIKDKVAILVYHRVMDIGVAKFIVKYVIITNMDRIFPIQKYRMKRKEEIHCISFNYQYLMNNFIELLI